MRRFTMAAAVLVLCSFLAGASPLEIPLGSAPVIDGVFWPSEWEGAAIVELSANDGTIGVRVYVVHDEERLYFAFEFDENPGGKVIAPEIYIDADNGKTNDWASDDWWFHVSAKDCDAHGGFGSAGECAEVRAQWTACPNYRPVHPPIPLEAIEIEIPIDVVQVGVGKPFGLALAGLCWPSDTQAHWPEGASIESPATWGEAVLMGDEEVGTTEVRYLGANGWAVTIGQRMLIFDYQEGTDPSPPPRSERSLGNGYVRLDELADYDVYVFVTHAHADHYDRVIYGWEDRPGSIAYLFGWEAGTNPDHHYFDEWRESAAVDGMDVYTIYSHHSGVPEVAYLVVLDDLVIYYNGDYKADYGDDFAYLRTITDRIDVAFLIGHPVADHQYFQQALLMDELLDVAYVFPMNREGEAYRCHEYADLLAEHGADATVVVAEVRGEVFALEL
jgi:L-ascorbate metabolism protein UlaG (beta-lactamase superfamily)